MSTPYVVKSGDWLSKIAAAHGFSDWRDIYYHPDNAAFRAQRPNPDLIYPGDVVMIPDQGGGEQPKPKPIDPQPTVTEVTAKKGDTFCSIASDNGFPDCTELRKLQENIQQFDPKWELKVGDKVFVPAVKPKDEPGATDATHEFKRLGVPPVEVRFVHGEADDTKPGTHGKLSQLIVSKFRTDRAGADRTKAFVDDTKREFNADAHDDVDAFKVEVRDPRSKASELKVTVEARKPKYDPAKTEPTLTGDPIDWEDYGATEKGEGRELKDLVVERMPKGSTQADKDSRFRSCYLRLVTDKPDWEARKKQTLRIEPLFDVDNKVEPLDHKIRATYVVDSCKQNPKCRAIEELPVGKDKKRFDMRLHVLRKSRGGDGVAPDKDVLMGWLLHVRQFYAQSNMSVKLTAPLRKIEPAANLIAIANRDGKLAVGDKVIKVEVTVDGTKKTVEIKTPTGAAAARKPIETAKKLAAAIEAAFGAAVVKAKASENPALTGAPTVGSADVLVGDPMTQDISITVVTNGDANHQATIGTISGTAAMPDFAGDESHVGTPHERVLLKNYDTGKNRIDCFIIHSLVGAHGEAFTPNATSAAKPKDDVINSLVVGKHVMTTRLRTIPHEIGHIVMDAGHVTNELSEIMVAGGTAGAKFNQEVDSTKRLADPTVAANFINYDDGKKGSSTKMLRTGNTTGIVSGW